MIGAGLGELVLAQALRGQGVTFNAELEIPPRIRSLSDILGTKIHKLADRYSRATGLGTPCERMPS